MLKNKFVLTAALVVSTLVSPILDVNRALAHHGWSEYNNRQTLNITGVIRRINYDNPHVMIQVETSDKKVWQAILAPPLGCRVGDYRKKIWSSESKCSW